MDPVKKISNFKFYLKNSSSPREVKQNVLLCSASSFRTLYKFIVNFFLVSTTNPWNLLKVFPTGRAEEKRNHAHHSFLLLQSFHNFFFSLTSLRSTSLSRISDPVFSIIPSPSAKFLRGVTQARVLTSRGNLVISCRQLSIRFLTIG